MYLFYPSTMCGTRRAGPIIVPALHAGPVTDRKRLVLVLQEVLVCNSTKKNLGWRFVRRRKDVPRFIANKYVQQVFGTNKVQIRSVSGPQEPNVSKAKPENQYSAIRTLYLSRFFCSHFFLADTALADVSAMWVIAIVYGQVTSRTHGLPFAKGTGVIPSGLFPSVRDIPEGSRAEGIRADWSAL